MVQRKRHRITRGAAGCTGALSASVVLFVVVLRPFVLESTKAGNRGRGTKDDDGSGDYALAVTAFGDSDFVGTGETGGRYVLDLKVAHPDADELVFNGSFEFGLPGWTNEITAEPFIPWTVSRAGDGSGFDLAPTAPQDRERVCGTASTVRA